MSHLGLGRTKDGERYEAGNDDVVDIEQENEVSLKGMHVQIMHCFNFSLNCVGSPVHKGHEGG